MLAFDRLMHRRWLRRAQSTPLTNSLVSSQRSALAAVQEKGPNGFLDDPTSFWFKCRGGFETRPYAGSINQTYSLSSNLGAQIGLDKSADIAVEHVIGVADLIPGAMIFDHFIRVQDI
jgi:hypothetical protein